jgi:hypothetical protein
LILALTKILTVALKPTPGPDFTPKALLPQWWNLYQGSQELVDFQEATYSGSYADYNIWTTLMQGDVLGCVMGPQ